MKKIIVSLVLIFALSLSALTVYAVNATSDTDAVEYYTFEDGMGKEEIPYGADDNVGTLYGNKNFKMMDETQAAAAGVPEGYSGWVLALDSKIADGISVGIDLTDIKVNDIERIRIRVWCPTGTKQDSKEGGIRFTGNGKTSWNMLASPDELCQWVDVTFEKSSYDSFDFDGDGYCDPFNFCLRRATGTAYIDHIIVDLKEADTIPPVITYNGETEISTTAGKELEIDATAFDERDNKNIAPEYIYSEGATDENGYLVVGEHTCTVRFTDAAGNSSEINLTLVVTPKDQIAPTINWTVEKLFASVGMRPMLNITAEDDTDGEIAPVLTWSEGALDAKGKLTLGEHTLTVTAIDSTGNVAETVISVVVYSGLPEIK